MLQDIIVRRWREATDVTRRVQAITPKEARKARRFFQYLSKRPHEKAREYLSGTNSKRNPIFAWFLPRTDALLNRNLAWLLFNDVLNLTITEKVESARRLLDWIILIAQYGDPLKYRGDALEAHCQFYQGVLEHREGGLTEAMQYYGRAETAYTNMGANSILVGLAIYAQGVAALELDIVEGDHKLYIGAREQFQRAMKELQRDVLQTVVHEVQESIDRLLHQWSLVNEFMRTDEPGDLVDTHPDLIDQQFLHLLEGRIWNLAIRQQSILEVLKAVDVTELVASYLGQATNITGKVDALLVFYTDSQQLDTAEQLLKERLKTHPDNLELQKILAYNLTQQGKYGEARPLLDEALKLNPDDAMLHVLLGLVLYHLEDLPEAESYLLHALLLDRDVPLAADMLRRMESERIRARDRTPPTVKEISEQTLERAEDLFNLARWPEAIEEYKLAIESDPDQAYAYMGLGDAYFQTGQYYLAIAYFEESLAIQPEPYTYRFLGDAYAQASNLKEAARAYRRALRLEPNYVMARKSLQYLGTSTKNEINDESSVSISQFLQKEHQPTKTEGRIAAMAQSMPTLLDILNARSLDEQIAIIRLGLLPSDYEHLLMELGKIVYLYKETDKDLDKALALAKLNYRLSMMLPREWELGQGYGLSPARHTADALEILGSIHSDMGDLSRALDCYQQAEEWYARDDMERSQRGITELSEYDLRFLKSNVQTVLFSHMANLYRKLGDTDKEEEYRHRAIEIDQYHASTQTLVTKLLTYGANVTVGGDFNESLKAFHQALDLIRVDLKSHQIVVREMLAVFGCMAIVLARLQLFRQALDYHKAALWLNQRAGPLSLELMSNTHMKIGKIFESRPDLGDALEENQAALRCASITSTGDFPFTWHSSEGTRFRVVDPELAWSPALAIGQVYAQRQAHQRADAFFEFAIELGEVMRSNVFQDEYRISFQASRMEAYIALIKLHTHLALEASTSGSTTDVHVTRAWRYAERARSRAFLDLLGRSSVRPPDGIPASFLNEEAALIERLRSLSQVRQSDSVEQKRSRLDEYDITRAILEKIWQDMLATAPSSTGYVDLRRSQPLEMNSLHELLKNV